MDLTRVDMCAIAPQLAMPEGDLGRQVGETMAEATASLNAFCVTQLQVQPRDHVLEIGFGPGVALAELTRLTPDGFVAGIDHSEEMLRMAEQRNHRAIMQEGVELAFGAADELPYEDDSFDKLLCVNVLHFWKTPAKELSEALRVLKPGGLALFFVTHPDSWPKGLAESGIFVRREPAEAEALLRASGFTDVQTLVFPFPEGGGSGYATLGRS